MKLNMQIYDWNMFDDLSTGIGGIIIQAFGRSDSVDTYLEIEGFIPSFYIHSTYLESLYGYDTREGNDLLLELLDEIKDNDVKYQAHNIKKITNELEDGNIMVDKVYKKNFMGFNGEKPLNMLLLKFKTLKNMKMMRYFMANNDIKTYEADLQPFLKFIHDKGINASGRITIDTDNAKKCTKRVSSTKTKSYRVTINDVDTDVNNFDIDSMVICAFDLECTSSSGNFPQAENPGDHIIQIGLAFARYGDNYCYEKILLGLKDIDYIDDSVDLRTFGTEKEMLLAFAKLINDKNPDILTGYNIVGFDFKYLHGRTKLLNIENEFAKISKIWGEVCPYKVTKQVSAQFGQIEKHIYDITGRIVIDIMKYVQRNYSLSSYKLDTVADYFIRERISGYKIEGDKLILYTKSTYGLAVNGYINITFVRHGIEDTLNEGKLLIENIDENKSITVSMYLIDEEELKKTSKMFWCQIKDDVTHHDIIKSYMGTSADRSKVGKYCVQDCNLCIILMDKLCILQNTISMSNVCHVPLSYIINRGQGIKIYSLVSRICSKHNFVIPTKAHTKDEDKEDGDGEDEDLGYQGAIVFEPKAGIHYDPTIVLDYQSLYPFVNIFKNISHEMYVNDTKYLNIEGYKYHRITCTDNSGKEFECIFAQKKDGSKAIIPLILDDLLGARKHYKKLMGMEQDPFKKEILNSLQLAYKITANSVYGQTGASTGSIYLKEIASSTTSVGRCMLLFSKHFIENIFSQMLVYIQSDNYTKYSNFFDNLFMYYPTTFFSTVSNTTIRIHSFDNTPIPDSGINCNFIDYGYDIKVHDDDYIIKFLIDNVKSIHKLYYYRKIIEMNEPNKICIEKFHDREMLLKYIDSRGYKSKEELKIKLYYAMGIILGEYKPKCLVIYGDTDSVFYHTYLTRRKKEAVNLYDLDSPENFEKPPNKEYLRKCIDIGIWSSIIINSILPSPMRQEYEKVLYPLILQGKKRYVGNLYEKDVNQFSQKSMGLELKRRDNSPIVKIICSAIVERLMNFDKMGAYTHAVKMCLSVLKGEIDVKHFVVTKSIKGTGFTEKEKADLSESNRVYADRSRLAHVTLADRITERDVGNRPLSGDRISYVYVMIDENTVVTNNFKLSNNIKCDNKKGQKVLQGHRIECPSDVINGKYKIDYMFYIENQIKNPVLKFLSLYIKNAEVEVFQKLIATYKNLQDGYLPISAKH